MHLIFLTFNNLKMKSQKKLESLKNDTKFDSGIIKAEVKGSGWDCGYCAIYLGNGYFVELTGDYGAKGTLIRCSGIGF